MFLHFQVDLRWIITRKTSIHFPLLMQLKNDLKFNIQEKSLKHSWFASVQHICLISMHVCVRLPQKKKKMPEIEINDRASIEMWCCLFNRRNFQRSLIFESCFCFYLNCLCHGIFLNGVSCLIIGRRRCWLLLFGWFHIVPF